MKGPVAGSAARTLAPAVYAAVFRQLRSQGTQIPTNDMWLAALVLRHRLVLCDRDRHLEHLPQLDRL